MFSNIGKEMPFVGDVFLSDLLPIEAIKETLQAIQQLDHCEEQCTKECSCNKSKKIEVKESDLELEAHVFAKEIIYCEPFTILLYYNTEGNIDYVISKCMKDDVYSKEVGTELCLYKALQKEIQKHIKKF